MAWSGGKPFVTRDQGSWEAFGKSNIGRIIGGEILPELPNPWQQHEVGISYKPESEQVLYRLIGAIGGNRSLPREPPQYLCDLKI
jgi:hypothetical protein